MLDLQKPLSFIAHLLLRYLKLLTIIGDYDIMKELDKRFANTDNKVDFKGEQRGRLSSNNVSVRCSPLDFLDTSSDDVTDDMMLDYLARIISEIYLQEAHGIGTKKEGSDLLPGVNQGTSRRR